MKTNIDRRSIGIVPYELELEFCPTVRRPTLRACISKSLPGRARRPEKVGTQPCTRRSLRLKAFASKRFGFPLVSPSI